MQAIHTPNQDQLEDTIEFLWGRSDRGPSAIERDEIEFLLMQAPDGIRYARTDIFESGNEKFAGYYTPRWNSPTTRSVVVVMGGITDWLGLKTLAHEIGHALDDLGGHPLQKAIGKKAKSHNRYRVECGSVAYVNYIASLRDWASKWQARDGWTLDAALASQRSYVVQYAQGKCKVDIDDLIVTAQELALGDKPARKLTDRELAIAMHKVGATDAQVEALLGYGRGILKVWRNRSREFKLQSEYAKLDAMETAEAAAREILLKNGT